MPDWKNLVRYRLTALNLTASAESDLADEVAQHLEDRYRDLTAAGTALDEAYRQVVAELESVGPLQAAIRSQQRLPRRDAVPVGDARFSRLLDGLWRDFRYALRSMRKGPVFAAFVVLTLALGIGANTTVFTVLNTLILNPLPARDPGELSGIAGAEGDPSKGGALFPLSYPDLEDYRTQNAAFDSLAGYTSPRPLTWQQANGTGVLFAELVTGNYFATLRLAPPAGRFFLPEEDTPSRPAVAVINFATWQTRFGGAPDIIGRTVRLNNVVFTVIGVAPRGFIGVNAIFGPDFWLPATTAERVWPAQMRNAIHDRGQAAFLGVGRRRTRVTEAQAKANIAAIASALARAYPDTDEGHTAIVRPIRDAVLANAGGGTSGQIVFAGAALLVVVGIVLLIACSNVANLLLARSAARRHEITIRLAMGARRARIVRQLLTEAVLLSLLGGACGLLLGYGGLRLLFGALPGSANFATPRFDGLVFAYTFLLSLATGFLFGAAPALRASRAGLAEALKETGRALGRNRSAVSLGHVLLAGQVAFSFLLLAAAALFLRSIGRAYDMDPGFQTAHLAVFSTNAGQAGYNKAQTKSFYKEARDRVAHMPGVTFAAWSSNMPLWARAVNGIQVEGRARRSKSDAIRAVINTVEPMYFETAGIEIRAGREFTDLDRDTSTPVVIVNQAMSHALWPEGAMGRRIQLPGETQLRQIIGIARTANYTAWGEPPQFCIYLPLEQNYSDTMALYIRTKGDPLDQITPVEREIHAVAPQVVVTNPRTGRQIIDGGLFSARMGVAMLSVFGLLALGLASIGLYGILAYAANQRRREIGLRMALGASRMSVLRLILVQGMSPVFAGIAVGLMASVAAGRVLGQLLYGVSGTDPLSLGAAAVVLTLVALAACYLPAHGATRVDPLAALRQV
ncbi:MAG: ABC transporter permease [Bryobacteraceae bacterium]